MPNDTTRLRVAIAADPGRRPDYEIAEAAGISPTLFSRIKNGHWNPDDPTKAAVAEALRKSDDARPVDELVAELFDNAQHVEAA